MNQQPDFCMKATFPDEKTAVKRIMEIKNNGRKRQKLPRRTYYCSQCGGWHLTSKPNRA